MPRTSIWNSQHADFLEELCKENLTNDALAAKMSEQFGFRITARTLGDLLKRMRTPSDRLYRNTPYRKAGARHSGFPKMDHHLENVLLTFPPRPITDGERQLLLDWIASTDDLFAFVSERRSDDPAIYRRIVVMRRATKRHMYLMHSPRDSDCWIVVSATEREDIGRFPTLRAALNYIRPTANSA